MTQALYAVWPDKARRSWGWAALCLVLVSYVLAAVPLFIITAIYMATQVSSGADPAEARHAMGAAGFEVLLLSLVVQFSLWVILTWFWARVFERRTSPTLGLTFNIWIGVRYGLGLVLGIVLLVLIGAAASLLGAGGGEDGLSELAGLSRLADPAILGLFALVIGVFLVQGGAEEVIFRGWLMSSLAARWGVTAGVIASSILFTLFHAHVFMSGLVFGLVAMTGIGLMGLMFAVLCLVTRSIAEAVAAHGAFNAAAITLPIALVLVQNPDMSFGQAFADVFASATGTAGVDGTEIRPELFAQGLAAGLIAAGLALLLIGRARYPRWKREAPVIETASEA
jgi:membrane protease YdiL (CAAX protease family)